MCLIAVKYMPGINSWVGVKNRDRTSKPVIRIRKSFRRGMERLYMWDDKTKYTEGINEHGLAILSCSNDPDRDNIDGLSLRTALFESDIELAAQKVIDLKVIGRTFIFTKDRLIEVDGSITDGKFSGAMEERGRNEIVTWESTSGNDDRRRIATREANLARTPMDLFDGMSSTDDDDPQNNPLILDTTRNAMRTNGQIMIVPSEMTLHYRALWGDVRFKLEKLNSPTEKTFFEIVSTRKLLSFGESYENI